MLFFPHHIQLWKFIFGRKPTGEAAVHLKYWKAGTPQCTVSWFKRNITVNTRNITSLFLWLLCLYHTQAVEPTLLDLLCISLKGTFYLLKKVLKIQYGNFSEIEHKLFLLKRKFNKSTEILYYRAKSPCSFDIDKPIKYLLFLASCLLLRPNKMKSGFKWLNFIYHHKIILPPKKSNTF